MFDIVDMFAAFVLGFFLALDPTRLTRMQRLILATLVIGLVLLVVYRVVTGQRS